MANLTTVDALIEELQTQVRVNRLKVDEVFRDFDRLKKGLITSHQFTSALGSLKFPHLTIQGKHYDMLLDHYAIFDEESNLSMVPYEQFIDDMDELNALKNLEKDPNADVSLLTTHRRPTGRNELTEEEYAVFDTQMHFFVQQTSSRGLFHGLKEAFQDFDTHNCGHITASQFRRCFPFNVDERTINILTKRYTEPATFDVNYLNWVTDIEVEVEHMKPQLNPNATLSTKQMSRGAESVSRTFVVPGTDPDAHLVPSVEELEQRIVNHCFVKRVRIHEYFHDFDPRRSGVVSRAQFASALTILGISLIGPELEMLSEKYRAEDSTPQGPKVMWLRFADWVDSVFTSKGMEKAPTIPNDTIGAHTQLNPPRRHV